MDMKGIRGYKGYNHIYNENFIMGVIKGINVIMGIKY